MTFILLLNTLATWKSLRTVNPSFHLSPHSGITNDPYFYDTAKMHHCDQRYQMIVHVFAIGGWPAPLGTREPLGGERILG